MQNKETETNKVMNITVNEAVAINQQLSKAKFTDEISSETLIALMPFKFAISKIDKDFQEFVKSVSDTVKTDRFKELETNQNKTKEEEEEYKDLTTTLTAKLNRALIEYAIKERTIDKVNIDITEFYTFCKVNNFDMSFIELLYNKLF